MDIKKIREQAKKEISSNWQGLFVGYIIFTVVVGIVSSTIIGIILIGPLAVGLASYMIKLTRKEKYQAEDLLDGFKKCFENSLVSGILVGLYTFLWSLLFIIPGIIKAIAYSMTYYIQVDNPEMKASEAISKSQELMMGHKMEYFKLMLGFIGWILLSILTFGILYVLYVGPYIESAKVNFYQKLVGKSSVSIELDFDPNKY